MGRVFKFAPTKPIEPIIERIISSYSWRRSKNIDFLQQCVCSVHLFEILGLGGYSPETKNLKNQKSKIKILQVTAYSSTCLF